MAALLPSTSRVEKTKKAVKLDSTFTQVRMDLAIAYYNNKQYLSAWDELKAVEKLGYKVSKEFIEILTKALPRPKD